MHESHFNFKLFFVAPLDVVYCTELKIDSAKIFFRINSTFLPFYLQTF